MILTDREAKMSVLLSGKIDESRIIEQAELTCSALRKAIER